MMRYDLGVPLNQRNWFAYMENGKLLMGIKHRYLTKNDRMRFVTKLHSERNGWNGCEWKDKWKIRRKN